VNVPSFASAPPTLVDGAGQIVAGRYRLEHPIARGAMGSIWRASHIELKAKVAIKFLDTVERGETELHGRFLQEARSGAAVRCAHVVQVFDYGQAGRVPFIVMELLEGETLEQRLAQRRVLTPAELDKIFREMATGVSRAHAAGVVHRDLKPSNVFIAREGPNEVTKLIDFGIAKVDEARLGFTPRMGTRAGTVIGTPEYMSPEQLRSGADTDHGVDLWALGIVAFECLTGKLPFSGKTLTDIVVQICTEKPIAPSALAEVPAGFDAWFAKATHRDSGRRFTSAEDMASALSAILTPPVEPAVSPAPRRAAARRALAELRAGVSVALTWVRSRRLPALPALPSLHVAASRKATLLGAAIACLAVGVVLSLPSKERAPVTNPGPGANAAEGDGLLANDGSDLTRPQPVEATVVQARLSPSDSAHDVVPSSPAAPSTPRGATGDDTPGAALAANDSPGAGGAAPSSSVANGKTAPGAGASKPAALAVAGAAVAASPAPPAPAERPRTAPNPNAPRSSTPSPSVSTPAPAVRAAAPSASKAAARAPQPAKPPRDPHATASGAAPAPPRAAAAPPAPARAAQGRPPAPEPGPAAKRPVSEDEALFAERL
jgi:eukaryotic-like serine/threonine-protein kinase